MLQEHFRPTLESIAEARHLAVQFLSDQPQTVRDSVALAVSELTTNAVRHARTEFDLEVRVVDRKVRVQVADENDAELGIRECPISELHGRGLQIVRGLSDSFGIDRGPGDGKAIWFEINS
jgi:anti-sigma regulatory factor (Ser/Thr protein kinase)